MQIKTILNQIEKFKSFVYKSVSLVKDGTRQVIEVEVCERKNSRGRCSGCKKHRSGYDRLPFRRFEFVPLWGIPVFFVYAPRRVECGDCGVRVEHMPWANGKHQMTNTYAWFLARWARRMSWKEVATIFDTSWDSVYRAVGMAVTWGLLHRDLGGIAAIGVDEIAWKLGHHYLTLVYQIDANCKRLLWVGEKRTIKTMLRFFQWLGEERSGQLKYICSDMWKPYLTVIARKAGHAIHVLDRFHIMAHMNKAIDEVRAQESRALKAKGYEPVLTKTRWLLLKRPENLTEKQEDRLADLVRYNLKSVRAYLLKEEFQFFWTYLSPYWAGKYLDRWCTKTMRSQIEPMKKVARMLRNHRTLLLNWFRAKGQLSSGIVEGLNAKAKLTSRKAYGFRTFRAYETALYHTLGALPEPKFTHKYC